MQSLSILIVVAELNWISTSRMPGALHHAGFEVTVLAPRDALVTKSRYARRVGHFPNDCTYPLWVQTLAAAVRSQAPALIVPADPVAPAGSATVQPTVVGLVPVTLSLN